ncbi:MAG TPA: sulfatase [Capillimicrobium sp.]|nr:sulfatase [Capillimicrobium sp.]
MLPSISGVVHSGDTPNVLYVHSHDTGRHVQPYGHAVETPAIQRLADEGVLFRHAFCTVPACSGSRAALLTGRYAHETGMTGLAHRGWALDDYGQHLVHTLRGAGYWTGLVGEQHVSADPGVLGYDAVSDLPDHHAETVAPAFERLLARRPADRPFFASVGFVETHRDFREPVDERDARCALPPANLPDTPQTRRDVAAFKASARRLDRGIGAVLDALDRHGLAESTLVIFTTDHGVPFPGAKATLRDQGLGVLLILRGPGGFRGGHVQDALVTHLDLFPTICDVAGIDPPGWLQGRSLVPLAGGTELELHDAVFGELTYHVAYEPQRSVRTRRWKYIRRFGDRERPVLANVDDGPSKDLLLEHGWADRPQPAEQLYDLVFDPLECHDLAGDPGHAPILRELRDRLDRWMQETGDPLLDGDVPPPPGALVNDPDDVSPETPPRVAGRTHQPA